MSDKRDEQFVDELLDASLARYGQVEAPAGLEERVLEELRARPAPPLWAWGWQPVAFGVAVLAVVAGVFYFTRSPAPRPAPVVQAPEAPTVAAPAPAPVAPPVVAARRTPAVRPQRVEAPRLAQFPAPAPLSEQERLLLRYVEQATPEQLLTARLGQGKLAALRIEPLRIPPLNSEPN